MSQCCNYTLCRSPALNGSSAIQHLKLSDAIKIRDGIIFNFYMGLPHLRTGVKLLPIITWYPVAYRIINYSLQLQGSLVSRLHSPAFFIPPCIIKSWGVESGNEARVQVVSCPDPLLARVEGLGTRLGYKPTRWL